MRIRRNPPLEFVDQGLSLLYRINSHDEVKIRGMLHRVPLIDHIPDRLYGHSSHFGQAHGRYPDIEVGRRGIPPFT